MRQLCLYFLYTDFLEVNKFGLVNIEQKFTSVTASWISTCCWLFQNLKTLHILKPTFIIKRFQLTKKSYLTSSSNALLG